MFAFRTEGEEHNDDEDRSYFDWFIEEDYATSSSSTPMSEGSGVSDNSDNSNGRAQDRNSSLRAARRFRSSLKHRLLRAMGRARAQRAEI